MRIAFLTEYDNIGGGESNLMNLCSALSKSVDVVLFCDGNLYEQASARGIPVRRATLSGRRWIRFLPFISLSTQLRSELAGFDVVHAYSVNVLPRLFMSGKPLVWTTHGYWERPYGMRARVINAFVDRVVTVSSDVDKDAKFGAKQRKIYLGTPVGSEVAALKSFDIEDIRIACVGRFQSIKGQDLLLLALGAFAKQHRNTRVTLELIGDVNGNEKADLEFRDQLHLLAREHATENLTVRFLGFQKQPAQYIRRADFVVVPSRYESFSMVAIEALACGKPVIAPAVGGPQDIIDSPELGMLFEAGNALSLQHVLEQAVAGFTAFSPEACIRRAQEFSIERQAAQHMDMYRELCRA
jgi:glycosyltransferase involved in cell wall biosynthesis